eukprot:353170_1
MVHVHLYWLLLYSTNGLLILIFIVSIQQFCFTNNFNHKTRLRRTLLVIINILGFIIENSLTYLSAIYPYKVLFINLTITTIAAVFEALILFIGFHTFRLLLVFMIYTVYNTMMNDRPPKWFTWFTNTLQLIIYLSILTCYGIFFIDKDHKWIFLFYVILMSVVIIISIFVCILIQKPIKLFSEIMNKNVNNKELKKGLLIVKAVMFAAIIMIIVATADLCFNVEIINDYFHFSCDFQFISIILHSVFVTGLSICLTLWIYKGNTCCTIPDDSVCHVYFCECCGYDLDSLGSNVSKNRKARLLILPDSDCTSINTNNVDTISGNRILTVTTLYDSNVTNVTVKTLK